MIDNQFDRKKVIFKPLSDRKNKKNIKTDFVEIKSLERPLSQIESDILDETVRRISLALNNRKPVILAFGAHTIKNGLAPILIKLMEKGWLSHLATNGAGIIHDWEFAYLGQTSENVEEGVKKGEFGNWQETGFYINLAINIGAYKGKGYGESVGEMIFNEKLCIPPKDKLREEVIIEINSNPDQAAAAAELLFISEEFKLECGGQKISHPYKKYSVQCAAYQFGIPFTGHPMIGHDIIYNHPMNNGALLGKAALRDFLTFAESISKIDGGVYISLGSAVMSPMIFEKSLSMAQNLAIQRGDHIDNHYILVVDLQKTNWDWRKGEPPEDNPNYYLRFNKSFSRMGGTMRYLSMDNRDFLLALYSKLNSMK